MSHARTHVRTHVHTSMQRYVCAHKLASCACTMHIYTLLHTSMHTHNCICTHTQIPYTVKLSSGKTFAVFQPIMKVFPLIHLLCTVHDGHGLMSFPVNSVFYAQPRKFSHSKVLPYTVHIHMSILRMCSCGVNLWLDCHSYLPLHFV